MARMQKGQWYLDKTPGLTREHYIARLEEFLTLPPAQCVASELHPKLGSTATMGDYPRLDLVCSGIKHMFYPAGGKVNEVMLPPGSIHYSPAYAYKLSYWDTPHTMSSVVFRKDTLRVTWIDLKNPIGGAIDVVTQDFHLTHSPPSQRLFSLCTTLDSLVGTPLWQKVAPPILRAILFLVCDELRRDMPPGDSPRQDATWQRVRSYLDENFHRAIVNRAYAAKVLHMSPGYLSTLFRERCGEQLSAWLWRKRLDYAANLLVQGELPIATIAESCGYCSVPSFTTAFRRRFGLPPNVYRQNHR